MKTERTFMVNNAITHYFKAKETKEEILLPMGVNQTSKPESREEILLPFHLNTKK